MGLGMQMLAWPNEFCKQLIDAGYQVYRFDNRDVGQSSKIKGKAPKIHLYKMMLRLFWGLSNTGARYRLEDMAEDTNQLMNILGVSSAHIVGASMGGMIAQIFAATYPEKVQTLNLLFSSNLKPFLTPPGLPQLKAIVTPPPNNQRKVLIETTYNRFKAIGSQAPFFDEESTYQLSEQLVDRCYYPKGILNHLLAILCTGSLVKYDQKIQKPTLIIHGGKDHLLWPQCAEAMYKVIKQADLHMIEKMGHDIQPYFMPEIIKSLISNFEKEHMTSSQVKVSFFKSVDS